MAISNESWSLNADGSVTVGFTPSPPTLGSQFQSACARYGAASGSYTGSQAATGPDGTGAYQAIIPAQTPGSTVYFVAEVVWSDTTEDSTEQSQAIPAANNGGTQSPAPTVSSITASTATIAWTSSDPGVGTVSYWRDGDGTRLDASESAPTLSHSVPLADLLGGVKYDFQYSTDFVDPSLPTAVSAQAAFNTAPDQGPPDPLGRLGVRVNPLRIAVGQSATITAQLLERGGSPKAGVPVHFNAEAGSLHGTLSPAQGVTDARGECSAIFKATGLSGNGRMAFQLVRVTAGSPPNVRTRAAMVFASPPKPQGGGHPGPGQR